MRGDVIGLVAADLVLRPLRAGMVGMPLVVEVAGMHLGDVPADVARLRVPADVVADLVGFRSSHSTASRIRVQACRSHPQERVMAGPKGCQLVELPTVSPEYPTP